MGHAEGLLSPADVINGIAQHDRRSVENLVVMGYIEEVPVELHSVDRGPYKVDFYRATQKGLIACYPWYGRLWHYFRGDIRAILVSAITSLLVFLITSLLTK